jgi:hypothetical protein
MSTIKNYGLTGVANSVQYGKTGGSVVFDKNDNSFNFTQFDISKFAGIYVNDVYAVSGDINILDQDKKFKINGATLGFGDVGVLKFEGTQAVMLPVGTATDRPTGQIGMIRANNAAGTITIEYFDGTIWKSVSSGGDSGLQVEIDNIETSLGAAIAPDGTFVPSGFTENDALISPTSFTNAIQQVANYVTGHDSLDKIFPQTAAANIIYSNGTSWQQALPGQESGVQGWSQNLTSAGALSSAGFVVRVDDSNWKTIPIVGTPNRIVISNNYGTENSDVTIDLALVTPGTTGNFLKVDVDNYGRVVGSAAVTAADITPLVDGTYLKQSGGTVTGNITLTDGATITGVPAPNNATDVVSKSYVDSLVSGLSWKQAAQTFSDIDVSITAPSNSIGGYTVTAGDRVLLTGQTDPSENGIWIFTGTGSAMYRATDADQYAELNGAAVFVQYGDYSNRVYTQTTQLTSFSGQNWVQFGGGGSTYIAGAGISIDPGNIISAKLGAGITVDSTSALTNRIYDSAGALILTTDGSTSSTAANAGLYLKLDSAGGLEQTVDGLKIGAGAVTPDMLQNSGYTIAANTGTATTVPFDKTLTFSGTGSPITTNISSDSSGTTILFGIPDASDTVKGVSSFDQNTFLVTSGNVTLKDGGISNAQLENSKITVTGDTGSSDINLGDTLKIAGGTGITTTQLNKTVTVASKVATTTQQGVASFDGTEFDVNAGAVSLKTVPVTKGGTGNTLLSPGQILYGNGPDPVAQTDRLAFDDQNNIFTVGGDNPITIDGNQGMIAPSDSASDLLLMAGANGTVLVGPTGDVLLSSGNGEAFTIRATAAGLTLESQLGSTTIKLAAGTTQKMRIVGPTPVQYYTNLQDNDLVNKAYVDSVVTSLNGGTYGGS